MLWILLMAMGFAGGVDGHGPNPPASDGDAMAPLRLQDPSAMEANAAAVVLEYVEDSINQYALDDDGADPIPVLDQLVLGNVQLGLVKDRFALTMTLPVVGGSASQTSATHPGFADAEIRVPVTLVDGLFSATIVPILRLPFGDSERFLGDGGLGGGGTAAFGLSTGPLAWTANAGFLARPTDTWYPTEYQVLTLGGSTLTGGLGLGWQVAPDWGVHLESVGSWGFLRDADHGHVSPVEGSFAVRNTRGGLWWVAGVGTGLNGQFSSPLVRAFAGAGLRWGMVTEPVVVPVKNVDETLDVVVSSAIPVRVVVRDLLGQAVVGTVTWQSSTQKGQFDLVGGAGEVRLLPGFYDVVINAQGMGRQTRQLAVRTSAQDLDVVLLKSVGDGALDLQLTSAEGEPLADARVLVDGLPVGEAGSGGEIAVQGLADGPHQVVVQAHGYRSWNQEVSPSSGAMSVQLFPVEGTLRVMVFDERGDPIPDAFVTFRGQRNQPAAAIGPTGERVFVLTPGTWTALVSSQTYGLQGRDVVLEADAWTTVRAQFVMRRGEEGDVDLRVAVRDIDGVPVDRAVVGLDDGVLGETSSGGDLSAANLLPGTRDLSVSVIGAAPIEVREILLQPGKVEVATTVHWLPGMVSVRVRSPDGPVGDAVVVAVGPSVLSPMPLGQTGQILKAFEFGDWEILVTSETWGAASRRIHVDDRNGSLQRVEVVLRPVENEALAELRVDVVDPDGAFVPGAQLALDDVFLGTSSGSTTVLPGLLPGSRTLHVQSAGWRPWDRALTLRTGLQSQEVSLDWRHVVRVRAEDALGNPVPDAMVRLVGTGGATPPMLVDSVGERHVPADAGTWQLIASSQRHGFASTDVEIALDAAVIDAVVRFPEVEHTQLLVSVRDTLDRVVPGAELSCVGCGRAQSSLGGVLLLDEVPEGTVELKIMAPNHRSSAVQWDVRSGAHERIAVLEPLSVQTRIRVSDVAGNPVDAQIRLDGPQRVPPVWTGDDGEETLPVLPGRWRVTAIGEGFGAQRRDVLIEPGAQTVAVDFVLGAGKVQVVAGRLNILEQVHFALGSAALEPGSETILQEVADTLLAHPALALLEIQGHSDVTGDLPLNQALSEARATAVLKALVQRGVARSRLRSRGYGPTRPVADNETDEGRTANRRVQFETVEHAAVK